MAASYNKERVAIKGSVVLAEFNADRQREREPVKAWLAVHKHESKSSTCPATAPN